MATIQKNLLKYIPKKAQKYLTWLDKWDGNYLVAFDISAFEPESKEDYQEYCDTVSELRDVASWFVKQYINCNQKNPARRSLEQKAI